MHLSKLLKILVFILLLPQFSLAQNAAKNEGRFLENNLPDKTFPTSETERDRNKNSLEITKSKIIKLSDTAVKTKDTIASILLNQNNITSLMFDDEQSANIERAVDALRNNEIYSADGENIGKEGGLNREKSEKSYVFLASIIFFSVKDWAVWINDQKITPETNRSDKEIYLKSVQREEVNIVWKMSISKWRILAGNKAQDSEPKVGDDNKVTIEFQLKPNQTFILGSNATVEGRAVEALLKNKNKNN